MYLSVTSQLTVESRIDRAENAWGLCCTTPNSILNYKPVYRALFLSFFFFVAYEKFEISRYFPSTLVVLRLAELFLATLKSFRSITETSRTLEQTVA